jgi:3-dehydroquinate synthase
LIGLIDAGVGIKNGINFCEKKSALGSFYPPELALLDPEFLLTLGDDHIKDGLSEAIKMALISDAHLFDLIESNASVLAVTKLASADGYEIIRRSAVEMLRELSENLYELDGYKRKVDFGHTFSPHIEARSSYKITHGQAVAIDIAISTKLACQMGILSNEIESRILDLLERLGLPLYADVIDSHELYDSLVSVVAHRNGALNLVVPTALGRYTFVESLQDLSRSELTNAIQSLGDRYARSGSR